jgi:hypothetical protein
MNPTTVGFVPAIGMKNKTALAVRPIGWMKTMTAALAPNIGIQTKIAQFV